MTSNCYDVLDTTDGDDNAIELAHAVSARVAAELAGVPVEWIEDRVELSVGNVSLEGDSQELLVRRTCDDPQT